MKQELSDRFEMPLSKRKNNAVIVKVVLVGKVG